MPWETEPLAYRTVLNPDGLFVKGLKKRIKDNNGYCPCKIGKISTNKCPCDDYTKGGYCECGMFINIPIYPQT